MGSKTGVLFGAYDVACSWKNPFYAERNIRVDRLNFQELALAIPSGWYDDINEPTKINQVAWAFTAPSQGWLLFMRKNGSF